MQRIFRKIALTVAPSVLESSFSALEVIFQTLFFSVYVDASDKCNELAFNFQEGTSTVTRTWSIRVTQYDCSYSNLAPQGCTQYFYGATSGLVRTYNFDGGIHLADQDQNICVR